jgi:type II secretory pathway component PulK
MRCIKKKSNPRKRKAVILLAVLVVVVLLTLAAYQYSELVTAEYRAADSYARSSQARAFAASGVHYVAAIVGNSTNFTNLLNGNSSDNPTVFQGVIVAPSDQPRFQGRFSIVSPLGPDDSASSTKSFRYGLTDEGGKINVNALMNVGNGAKLPSILMNVPNMTQEIANCIVDWIDSNDDPTLPGGAENDYYSGLSPPYRCKNGPLDSPEEMLLIKGITPPLFLGNDLNRNGILDPGEDDGTGVVNQGWSAYLTCYGSRQPNVANDGTARVWINDPNLNTLRQNLQTALGSDAQELINYIMLCRLHGPPTPMTGTRGPTGVSANNRTLALQQLETELQNPPASKPAIPNRFSLVNSYVNVPIRMGGTPPRTIQYQYSSPLTLGDSSTLQQLLPILLDKVWTSNDTKIPARINVNTAPRAVLTALMAAFNLPDAGVQSIIDNRPSPGSPDASDPIFQTPAWLITKANFSPTDLGTLDQFITASSQVYRIQSIGYFDGGGPTARIEAVIDGNNQRPRIVSWRDLTELGKGFDIGGPQ